MFDIHSTPLYHPAHASITISTISITIKVFANGPNGTNGHFAFCGQFALSIDLFTSAINVGCPYSTPPPLPFTTGVCKCQHNPPLHFHTSLPSLHFLSPRLSYHIARSLFVYYRGNQASQQGRGRVGDRDQVKSPLTSSNIARLIFPISFDIIDISNPHPSSSSSALIASRLRLQFVFNLQQFRFNVFSSFCSLKYL